MKKVEGVPQLYVGYDINDKYIQISYLDHQMKDPISLSNIIGSKKFQIPTVLCKKKAVGQWFYGDEAIKVADGGEGTLVTDLLSLCVNQTEIEIDGETYNTNQLFLIFIKKTLKVILSVGSISHISRIIFTLEEIDKRTIALFNYIKEKLEIENEKISVEEYKQSFFYYVFSQQRQIWNNDILCLDYQKEKISYYLMKRNIRTRPQVVSVNTKFYFELAEVAFKGEWDEEKVFMQRKEFFEKLFEESIRNEQISSVFLIGKEFEEDWAKQFLEKICKGKRVFSGSNLFTKGAAYGARAVEQQLIREQLYLGDEKVKYNIGIMGERYGNEEYILLVPAGNNWYDIESRYIILVNSIKELNLLARSVLENEEFTIRLEIPDLPIRPKKATRLEIGISFLKDDTLKICIKDLGFGEFFKSSEKSWEFIKKLKNKEVVNDTDI